MVRLLKIQGSLREDEILASVSVSLSRLRVRNEEVKAQFEYLEEEEYMCRDPADSKSWRYLA